LFGKFLKKKVYLVGPGSAVGVFGLAKGIFGLKKGAFGGPGLFFKGRFYGLRSSGGLWSRGF
jgi:hypothetical protein